MNIMQFHQSTMLIHYMYQISIIGVNLSQLNQYRRSIRIDQCLREKNNINTITFIIFNKVQVLMFLHSFKTNHNVDCPFVSKQNINYRKWNEMSMRQYTPRKYSIQRTVDNKEVMSLIGCEVNTDGVLFIERGEFMSYHESFISTYQQLSEQRDSLSLQNQLLRGLIAQHTKLNVKLTPSPHTFASNYYFRYIWEECLRKSKSQDRLSSDHIPPEKWQASLKERQQMKEEIERLRNELQMAKRAERDERNRRVYAQSKNLKQVKNVAKELSGVKKEMEEFRSSSKHCCYESHRK